MAPEVPPTQTGSGGESIKLPATNFVSRRAGEPYFASKRWVESIRFWREPYFSRNHSYWEIILSILGNLKIQALP